MPTIHECSIKKYLDNKDDVNLALLQMRSTPIGTELPIPATLLINRPIRAFLLQINREPFNFDADREHYEALKTFQDKYIKGNVTHKDSFSFYIGSSTAVKCEDGIHGHIA